MKLDRESSMANRCLKFWQKQPVKPYHEPPLTPMTLICSHSASDSRTAASRIQSVSRSRQNIQRQKCIYSSGRILNFTFVLRSDLILWGFPRNHFWRRGLAKSLWQLAGSQNEENISRDIHLNRNFNQRRGIFLYHKKCNKQSRNLVNTFFFTLNLTENNISRFFSYSNSFWNIQSTAGLHTWTPHFYQSHKLHYKTFTSALSNSWSWIYILTVIENVPH